MTRCRLRDLGITIGKFKPGKFNAITDVKGVKVGHSTIIKGDGDLVPGKGPVRTGVTAIVPNAGDAFTDSVIGGSFILNGAGEMSGLIQVQEWGLIETPILLTNTLSVGSCSKALVRYMTEKYPAIGDGADVVIPLVGECDDSWLNDIAGQHVKYKHVCEALNNASDGKVAEGNVGGGTGMVTCGFKGGIGTASRKLPKFFGGFTIGILVMCNFGVMPDLCIKGVPVGEMLFHDYQHMELRTRSYGSIIAVLATDAPLTSHQLNRLAKRVALGIGRAGSSAAHGSGEIILAFSTTNVLPRNTSKLFYKLRILLDKRMNPLYEAAIEATEEAIANSLCAAEDMRGVNNHLSPAIPIDKVAAMVKRYTRS